MECVLIKPKLVIFINFKLRFFVELLIFFLIHACLNFECDIPHSQWNYSGLLTLQKHFDLSLTPSIDIFYIFRGQFK